MTQSWLNIWTLWDIFFVLIVAFSIGKLFGWRWTPLALAALGLSYGFSYAPRWTWIHLIVATALLRVLPEGGWRMPVHAYRGVTLVVLGVLLAIFTHSQIQSALHPQTGDSGTFHPHEEATESLFWQVDNESATQRGSGWTEYRGSASQKKKEKVSLYKGRDKLQQVAPNAVVQTGPGVPSWDWTRVELNWSGPVSRNHRIELWLISPMVNRVLAFVRLVLILGLALLLMIRPRGEAEPEPRGSYDRGLKQLRQTLMGRGIVWVVAFGSVGLAARARAQSSQAQQRQASESNASSTENEPPDVGAPGDRWASTLGDQLEELETRMLEASRCQGPCVVVNRLELDIQGRQVTMRGELDIQRDAGWTIPGPRGALALESIRLDGRSTSRLRRASDGLTAVYVPEGRHTVKIEGQLSTQDVVTLRFGDEMRPRHLTFTSDDWTIEGLAPSGSVDNSIQLTRLEQASDQETDSPLDKRVELPPWFQVDRTFELGLPWRVETTISRTNASRPERLQYPLLKGENVITEGVSVESGRARLNFEKGETTVSFESELEVADRLEFRAPEDKPWTETWTLECSRIWRCDTSGIPPTQLVGGDAEISRPVWHPWPGESLTLEVDKPEAVPGESMTIESTTYEVEFGQRLMTGTLTLTIRATQGGQQQVTLPEEAILQSTSIDEETRNFQLNEDQELTIPVTPGSQTIEVSWQQPWERKFTERAPPVDIDGQAVDVETIIDPGDERWILWLEGPEWGPAVLFWSFLMLMLVVAIFLGRLQGLQPTTLEWMLLVAGFSQLPVAAFVPVVAWFALLAIRREYWPDRWWVFNFMQLTIVGLTFVAAGVLYAALHTNFLVDIDMQIQGAQSHSDHLRWYVDRTFGMLPRPSIVTLPLFAWRLLMLGWAIWLVNRLLTWVPWGWESFSRGQLVASWHDDEDEELHDDGEADPPAEGTIDGDGVPPFARTSEAELSDEPSPERPRDEGEETTPSDETSESRAAPADSPTPSNESKDGENISDAAPDGPEARAETERSSDEASKEGDAPEDSRDD